MDINLITDYLKANPAIASRLMEQIKHDTIQAQATQIQDEITCHKREIQRLNLAIGREKQKITALERRLHDLALPSTATGTTKSRPVGMKPAGVIYMESGLHANCLAHVLNTSVDDGTTAAQSTTQDNHKYMTLLGHYLLWKVNLTPKMLDMIRKEINCWPASMGACKIVTASGEEYGILP